MNPKALAYREMWLFAKKQRAKVEAENGRLMEELYRREVTDFHLGQLRRLGVIDEEPVIYMQALLNDYGALLRMAMELLIENPGLTIQSGFSRQLLRKMVERNAGEGDADFLPSKAAALRALK